MIKAKAKKNTSKKSTLKKAATKKTIAKKTAAKKSTVKKKSAAKTTAPKSKSKKTTAKRTISKKKMASRLDNLKDKLLLERERLLKEINIKHNPGQVSAHGDLVDQSANFSEQETLLGLAEHDRHHLKTIDDALTLIQKGTYGICAMCTDEIPEARLLAMPTAKHCLVCQSKAEKSY